MRVGDGSSLAFYNIYLFSCQPRHYSLHFHRNMVEEIVGTTPPPSVVGEEGLIIWFDWDMLCWMEFGHRRYSTFVLYMMNII